MRRTQHMQITFFCPYSREGCRSAALTSVDQLTSHVASCPYRPLECRLYLNSGFGQLCGHTEAGKVPFSSYKNHLLNHHSLYKVDLKDGWCIDEYCIEKDKNIEDEAPDPSWNPVTFDCDGMTFLLVQSLWDEKLYWRVFVIGTEDDAKKYKGYIQVCSSEHVDTPETVILGKLEVLPVRMYSTDLIWLGSRDEKFKRTYLSLLVDKVEDKFEVEEGALEGDPRFVWKVCLSMEKKK